MTAHQSAFEAVEFKYEGQDIVLFANGKDDHLYKHFVLHNKFYELDLLSRIREIHKRDTIIVDVGANIGNHTVFFSKIMRAKVVAFEPFPLARSILIKNVHVNGCLDVSVSEKALGEVSGAASAGVFDPRNIGTVCVSADTSGDLVMGRLDDSVAALANIGVIKIDIEGGELNVLKGAQEILRRCHPELFIEAHSERQREELRRYLEPFSYEILGKYCATPTYWFG
jgi:FkbM family methyltransferase